MLRIPQLATRLRTETAELHRHTEELAGVPGRVSSVEDYADLLRDMLAFHAATEFALSDKRWASEWGNLGVTIGDHERSNLIREDLSALGFAQLIVTEPTLLTGSFAEALGCLYVVEGSSLGGMFIGPAIVQKLGLVPTAYYDGRGRDHPAPWRRVKQSLGTYESNGGDPTGVIAGAIATFTFFGSICQNNVASHELV